MANRDKAIKMASNGASAKDIRQATGVNAQAARNIVSRVASTASPYNASNTTISSAPPTAGPLASGYVPLPATTNTTTTQPTNPYKDIENIRQGLAIGGNSTISSKEAMKIANNTGKSFDQVLAKGLGLGFDVSAKAANKSNQRYAKSMPGYLTRMGFGAFMQDEDPLAAMRNQKVNKGYSYQGVAVKDGPGIFGRKDVGKANPLAIRTKPGDPPPSGDPPPGPGPGDGDPINNPVTPVEQLPVTPEEKMPLGPGGLTGGGGAGAGAAGLQRKKSYLRSLGIRGLGQLGRDQIRNMYKQTVNINR